MLLSARVQHPHDLGASIPVWFPTGLAPTPLDASQHLSVGIFLIRGCSREGVRPPWAFCKG